MKSNPHQHQHLINANTIQEFFNYINRHPNISQSHVKTRANTIQEFLNLWEAMQIPRRAMGQHVQIPRRATWKYIKHLLQTYKYYTERREKTYKYTSNQRHMQIQIGTSSCGIINSQLICERAQFIRQTAVQAANPISKPGSKPSRGHSPLAGQSSTIHGRCIGIVPPWAGMCSIWDF